MAFGNSCCHLHIIIQPPGSCCLSIWINQSTIRNFCYVPKTLSCIRLTRDTEEEKEKKTEGWTLRCFRQFRKCKKNGEMENIKRLYFDKRWGQGLKNDLQTLHRIKNGGPRRQVWTLKSCAAVSFPVTSLRKRLDGCEREKQTDIYYDHLFHSLCWASQLSVNSRSICLFLQPTDRRNTLFPKQSSPEIRDNGVKRGKKTKQFQPINLVNAEWILTVNKVPR